MRFTANRKLGKECPQVAENSAMQAVVSVFQHRIFAIKIFKGNIDKGNIRVIIKTGSTKTECREVKEDTIKSDKDVAQCHWKMTLCYFA